MKPCDKNWTIEWSYPARKNIKLLIFTGVGSPSWSGLSGILAAGGVSESSNVGVGDWFLAEGTKITMESPAAALTFTAGMFKRTARTLLSSMKFETITPRDIGGTGRL